MAHSHGRTLDWRKSLDPRNDLFPMRTELHPEVVPVSKVWRGPPKRLDQGREGACVGFSQAIDATSFPVRVRQLRAPVEGQRTLATFPDTQKGAEDFARALYHWAQYHDQYASTPPEDGSSVNAGMKASHTAGLITGWLHARDMRDVRDWVITKGPVVVGIPWLNKMFDPGENFILDVSGAVAGGHAICVRGFLKNYYGEPTYVLRNSWGEWGDRGDCYVREVDLDRLIFQMGGESMAAVGRN